MKKSARVSEKNLGLPGLQVATCLTKKNIYFRLTNRNSRIYFFAGVTCTYRFNTEVRSQATVLQANFRFELQFLGTNTGFPQVKEK